jgi:septal ring factor EnvC (AmiA/AmiB activator)
MGDSGTDGTSGTSGKIDLQKILTIVIIFLLVWNIFNMKTIRTDVKDYNDKINVIVKQVESTQKVNKEIDKKVGMVNDNIRTITNEIYQIDNNLTIVKQQTNEKVNSVNNVGNVELERLFTERYKQSDSTN